MPPSAPTLPTKHHTSILHQRIEETLALIVDRYVPARLWTMAANFAPLMQRVGPTLLGLPSLKGLPPLPANADDLKAIIHDELANRPPQELASQLAMLETVITSWLSQYEAESNQEASPAHDAAVTQD